jgi:hypothetical protein
VSGATVGRRFVWDEGQGGAYYLDGGALCHAEYLHGVGRFDWDCGAQVDSRDLLSGDPGWDYAQWAEKALQAAAEHCLVCGVAGGHEPGCTCLEPDLCGRCGHGPKAGAAGLCSDCDAEADIRLEYREADLTEEELASLRGEDLPDGDWCSYCLVEGHEADDCPERPA